MLHDVLNDVTNDVLHDAIGGKIKKTEIYYLNSPMVSAVECEASVLRSIHSSGELIGVQ